MESEIVITGMSGRFPESDNVAEFSENLYNKKNLVTESTKRWEPGLYGLPHLMGTIKDISKFDAGFFGVHHKQAHQLDPQARILLESTYESIVDAGYDPEELRGKSIGVFIGNCSSESDEYFTKDAKKINGYAMTGCCRAMFANRVSYTFDFKGPSFIMDTACSSGAMALHEAVNAIKNNECEAAIVGGANLCLRPGTALQFYKLNMLSDDGTCKSFDALGNGYGRSEAVVTLFLQKANVARRVYASLVHVKTNTDGFKDAGITFPSAEMQKRLLQEVYDECRLNPLKISYVEAHGTGTPAGDPIEMLAISDIFCKGRKEPLLVGAVKSNMGHSEPSSGLCSLVKVLIAMESGVIPPNLHFQSPNPNIPALVEGRVKIVSDPLPWTGGYASISCFGFGGVNIHAVLKSNPKEPEPITPTKFPQLTLYSGRTEEAVETLFEYLDKNSAPRDFFALLHKSVYAPPQSKPHRGFKVLGQEESVTDIKHVPTGKRPVWYIFSGMGTQWPAMAKDLMNLEVFSRTIHKLAKVMKPFNLNLIELVINGVSKKDNKRTIIPAFVSIAAVQVALVDVLTELGIQPDGMVGHSVGELGCAYADGCFTGEQMILAAYWRGKAVEEANLIEGAMAALGITWEEAKKQCPKAIFPSCHNAEDSITISGPKKEVGKFVEQLKADNIFAREVDSCGYAFHSQYIFPAAEKLQRALESVIPNPKPRSTRWVSSSYPEEEWDVPTAKMASASYFVHNLVSPVLFHEALHHVPKDAIVIEIAPHHLLQAILKRVIGPNAEFIGLMKRYTNNSVYLLSSIGKMYTSGMNPDIEKLYPPVALPVARGTPMISSLVKWDHSESWTVATWEKSGHHSQMVVEVDVGAPDSNDAYMLGHCIDGRALYPATGYLMLAWKALAELKSRDVWSLPVAFEEVKIHRATVISKSSVAKLLVDITSAGGQFEISEAGLTVATGRIFALEEEEAKSVNAAKYWEDTTSSVKLNSSDVYKELRLMGFEYGPTFQGVKEANVEGDQGLLNWNENWVVFLDTLLQFSILSSSRALQLPTRIGSIKINPFLQKKMVELTKNMNGIPVTHNRKTQKVIAGGVEIKNLYASIAPRQPVCQVPLLEEYHFIPNHQSNVLPTSEKEVVEKYVHVCSSIAKKVLEAAGKSKDQISDVMNGFHEVGENVITSYLQNLTEEHVLLKNLQQMCATLETETLSKIAKLTLANYLKERDTDILEKTLVGEIPLRTVLDIVMENTRSKKLNIFEAHDGNLPFSLEVQKTFQNFNITPFNYTVAHPNPDLLGSEAFTASGLKTVEWSPNSTTVPDVKDVDLLVIKNWSSNKKELKKTIDNLSTVLKDNGFLLVMQRTRLVPAELFLSALSETPIPTHSENDLEQIFKDLDLPVIAKKSDGLASSMYLLRKIPKSSSHINNIVVNVQTGSYDTWVEELKTELSKAQSDPENNRIWLVAQNDANNGIIGLVNCLRQEPGGASIKCIFADSKSKLPAFEGNSALYHDVVKRDLIMNVFKNGAWGSFRHISIDPEKNSFRTQHAYINVLTRGDLSSLKWIDSPLKYYASSPIPNTTLCQVYYAPLNFRDVMLASGKLPPDAIPGDLALQDCILGFEFSGRNSKGERIMGLVACKGMATTVAADAEFLWKVPDSWTLEEASSVPVAYSTAYYALVARGGMKRGEKVLIHSGSGGVGQAAIAIALSMGCRVFTTVGSTEKREFLKKRFPQLTDAAFCNSRDTSFEAHVLNATNGEGVDIVLNSLADEKLKASLCCLAEHGRFLEIGKYDLSNNTPLGMAIFLKNIAFHGILLDALFQDSKLGVAKKREVVELVNEGIRNGTVKPLNTILFNNDQVEQAFRYMASGRHIGKVVLKIRDEEPQKVAVATPVQLPVTPRTSCDPKKTYIVIGGLGGFGLELCHWLIDRGAVNIVLTSRSGVRSGYQHLCLRRWKIRSANIVVSTLDATDHQQAKELLALASKHGPIGGIFNLALVLRDAFMENQTAENYKLVCQSKVESTVNLDDLSRKLCPNLDWFVCFSSVSCGRGNAGQSNYGFANSVMERICEQRNREGYPGLAIQWGAIGDVGVLQETVGNDVVIGGTVPQRILSCLKVLDQFLTHDHPVVSSFVPYRPADSSAQKSSKHNALAVVANVFGIKDISTINLDSTLGELGMDSLMGVEIQQFLERHYEMALSIQDLRQIKMKDLKKLDSGPAPGAKSEEKESEGKKAKVEESEAKERKIEKSEAKERKIEKSEAKERKIEKSEAKENKVEKEEKSEPALEKIKEISSIFKDDLIPDKPMIPLNGNKKGIPLFIVHPIEGVVTMLNSVAKFINSPVFGLQYTSDAPSTSVEELAYWYLTLIKSCNIKGPINVAGYSFGASVAFEIALQAERNPKAHPKVKSIIMLDGSPALVTQYTRQHESHFLIDSQVEGEAQALCAFMLQFTNTDMRELKKQLLTLSNFEQRVSYIADEIIAVFPDISKQALSIAAKLYYHKLLMSLKYTPKNKLQRDVVLLKALEGSDLVKKLSQQYDLEKVCNGKIMMHAVPGNHKTFLQGKFAKETSKVINSIVDQ